MAVFIPLLLILGGVLTVPAVADAGFGDSIDANSPSALQELEKIGETILFQKFRNPENLLKERANDVANAKSERAIARALINFDEQIDEPTKIIENKREESLLHARKRLVVEGNDGAITAIDFALTKVGNYGKTTTQSNKNETTD